MPATDPPAPPPDPPRLPADAVSAVLDWYEGAHRELPWREGRTDAWGVLVSEIMLQQTPVSRVLPRWLDWMHRWPHPADLAGAAPADVLRAWDSLGYPRRALRLLQCAREIVDRHDGSVPATEEELRTLPGIGEYTAAAVVAFAHGRRTAVADTNIRRVLVRAVLGSRFPASALTAQERVLVRANLPADRERSVRWNQALMELGALVCTARGPHCDACPLSFCCAHLARGLPEHQGPPRRRQAFEGTDRQMRGAIMRRLREQGPTRIADLQALDQGDLSRVERSLASLLADGLAVRHRELIDLP